jgi:hypothetical protein
VGAERGQVDLYAFEVAVLGGDGVGRMQSGDERPLDRFGWLGPATRNTGPKPMMIVTWSWATSRRLAWPVRRWV